jgi:glycosyltransferase involved in cell wall biosynthesis
MFSVIIPARNARRWIAAAVESVRSQDLPIGATLEIVVVDDGSSDGTAAELQRLAGPDLHVIATEVASPGGARNAGIAAARGRLIAFLDSDDELGPNALRLLGDALASDVDAGFAYGDAEWLEADGSRTPRRSCPGSTPLVERLIWGNCLSMGTLLYRRSSLEDVGPFDEVLRTGEDWDLWIRSAKAVAGVHVPQPLALLRRSTFDDKYSLDALELATRTVLQRCFDQGANPPHVQRLRRRAHAWHATVLAKSHLRRRRLLHGAFHAARAVAWHPLAIGYLLGIATPPG